MQKKLNERDEDITETEDLHEKAKDLIKNWHDFDEKEQRRILALARLLKNARLNKRRT